MSIFLWFFFCCQNHLWQQKCHIRRCKWVKYQCNLFLSFILFAALRPYLIVWIFVCHKKLTHLDIFLNKLCSSSAESARVACRYISIQTIYLFAIFGNFLGGCEESVRNIALKTETKWKANFWDVWFIQTYTVQKCFKGEPIR